MNSKINSNIIFIFNYFFANSLIKVIFIPKIYIFTASFINNLSILLTIPKNNLYKKISHSYDDIFNLKTLLYVLLTYHLHYYLKTGHMISQYFILSKLILLLSITSLIKVVRSSIDLATFTPPFETCG